MAANSPRDPGSPSDDSNIFRRSGPKSGHLKPAEEPIELLDFEEIGADDEDALFGSVGPISGDSPSVIVRRGYTEGSAVNLGGKPGESGSSIFGHAGSLAPSAPGSGWFDSIPPVARSIAPVGDPTPSENDLKRTPDVEELFAGLPGGDSTAVPVAGWKDQQGTDSISESEVLRAFDNLSSRDITAPANGEDGLDFDTEQRSGSHIFARPDDSDIGYGGDATELDQSGVDLLNPERDEERFTGPKSSIFGAASHRDTAQTEIDEIPVGMADDHAMFAGAEGSSIFDRNSPLHALDGASPDSGDRASGTVDWNTRPVPDEFQPSLMMPRDLDADGSDPFGDELTDFTAPTPPLMRERGPVGTAGAGVVIAPPKRREPVFEDDDDSVEAPKPKRAAGRGPQPPEAKRSGSGLLGWVGGGVLGMLLGAGAFAGLYFADVLPAKDSAKATVPVTQPTAKDSSAELAALTTKNDDLQKELRATKAQEDQAKTKVATVRTELEDVIQVKDTALAKAKKDNANALKDLTAAEAEVKTALAAATRSDDDAKKSASELKIAMTELVKATADAKAALTDVEKAKAETKVALTDVEKAKADTKIYIALAEKNAGETEAAQKDALAKAKLATEAQAKVTDALKAQIAAEAVLSAVVKELKANKLLDEKSGNAEALALIPDVLKKLSAQATSADAKKAAEALATAKKDLDGTRESLKAAETAKAKADAAVKLAKDDAEAQVTAAAKKAAADVTLAKKDADKAKSEADVMAKLAVEKATADAKMKIADAEADLASLMMKHKAELALLQESFTGQLADARKGGAIQITPAEVLTQDRAARDYSAGVLAYQSKSFPKALAALESAVKLDPVDARYWYYLGLAQLELGKKDEADASFKKGHDLELRSKPNRATVGEALERIQGAARRELNRYR